MLQKYPLTIGKLSQFSDVPSFTVESAKSPNNLGGFAAAPTNGIRALTDVQAWFESADAKTSLLILRSLYYQLQPTSYVVKIPELGIQVTVPADLGDLTYQVQMLPAKDGSKSPTAYFSTSQLTAADPGCSASYGPLGALGRSDGQYPTSDPTAAIDYGHLVKQFSTFYITEGFPQGACSANANAEGMAASFKTAFESAVSTAQQLN